MALPITDPSAYYDLAGLDSLKRAVRAKDPQALRAVARQFESLFARMMIKSMRQAIGPDPLFGSDQEQMYQSIYDDQLAVDLTRGRGLGLADMLVRQLQQRAGVSGSSTAGGAGALHGAGTQDSSGASGSGPPSRATGPAAGGLSYDRLPGARRQERAFPLQERAYPLRGSSSGRKPSPLLRMPPRAGSEPASSATRARFIRSVWPHAAQAARALGVAPASLVAQAALETNWGQDIPRDAGGRSSHNLFGMKAGGRWQGADASAHTQEFSGGAARETTAAFRVYDSPAQSFADYVALLRNDPRYAAALNTGGNVQAFAAALQRGGYATDPDYARKVVAVAASLADLAPRAMPSAGPLKLAGAQPINVRTRTL